MMEDYKNRDFRNKRSEIIFDWARKLTPVMNELHDKDYSFSYWLLLLQDHLKVCINRRSYLLKPNYHEPILKYPINSWSPPRKSMILKSYLVFLINAIRYRKDINKELKKIYGNKHLLFGLRADELNNYINGTKIGRIYIWKIFFKKGDRIKRKRLQFMAEKTDSMFLKKIILAMPTILVEHYDYINSLFETKNPNDKCIHVEHGDSFFADFLMARYRENGARIISYQGGGFQGEIHNHPDKIKYELCDEFHTYGWKVHKKDFPDNPYRLIQYKRKWDEVRSIKNHKHSSKVMIVFSVINEEHIQKYLTFTESFFSIVPKNIYKNLVIRLRPVPLRVNKSLYFRKLKIPKSVTIDWGEKKMAETAAKVNIVILTTLPATNFLECIYVGQPVMAVNTNDNPSELFRQFVPDLERLGVIHKTPFDLTEYFLNIEDYQQWWLGVEQDPIFQNFATLFAGKRWNKTGIK